MLFSYHNLTDTPQKIREMGVAGSFYSADPHELTATVDRLLSGAYTVNQSGEIFGFIAPHAGYFYSGQVAAETYIQLRDKDIDRIVIIAPSHLESFRGASVYDGDAYQSPLGLVPVDREFAARLAETDDDIRLSAQGHETRRGGRMEHAIEVQIPFLQRTVSDFRLVPIIMGDQSYETCRTLGRALAGQIRNSKTVIIASSDLSHFHDADQANVLDKKVINAISEWDYFNLSRNLNNRYWEACGGGPIVAMMIVAEMTGANRIKILRSANSGDIPGGDRSRVVGYVSAMFYRDAGSGEEKSVFSLGPDQQKHLLKIAHMAVEEAVRNDKIHASSDGTYNDLSIERGAFVTLKIEGQLRGCIGYTSPVKPLHETVRDVAISAATRDPRFPEVSENEISRLEYEISVLSPFRHVTDIGQIKIGTHGLLIKQGNREGLLLPQVAEEYEWDIETFLNQTCRKAGLPIEAWKDESTDIFMFSAFVFGEH